MVDAKELTADKLSKEAKVDGAKWNKKFTLEELEEFSKKLEERGFKAIVVDKKKDALEQLKKMIPWGAEVMNGSSTTLNEIGFTELLRNGNLGWKSLHEPILAEKKPEKQAELRRRALLAEYFVTSVNAIAGSGELVASDASGSRVGALPFAAERVIVVAGMNKIVPTLQDALARDAEYAYPLEDVRAKKAYGMSSGLNKTLILAREMQPGRITVILVKEKLGF